MSRLFLVLGWLFGFGWYPGERWLAYVPFEVGIAYDNAGRILFEQQGSAYAVQITESEARQLDRDSVFTHNHPAGFCPEPSRGDYYFAWFYNLKALRVVSLWHGSPQVYQIARTGADWPTLNSRSESCAALDKDYRTTGGIEVSVIR